MVVVVVVVVVMMKKMMMMIMIMVMITGAIVCRFAGCCAMPCRCCCESQLQHLTGSCCQAG